MSRVSLLSAPLAGALTGIDIWLLVSVGVGMTRVGMTRMFGVDAGVLVGAAVGAGLMTRTVGVGAGVLVGVVVGSGLTTRTVGVGAGVLIGAAVGAGLMTRTVGVGAGVLVGAVVGTGMGVLVGAGRMVGVGCWIGAGGMAGVGVGFAWARTIFISGVGAGTGVAVGWFVSVCPVPSLSALAFCPCLRAASGFPSAPWTRLSHTSASSELPPCRLWAFFNSRSASR